MVQPSAALTASSPSTPRTMYSRGLSIWLSSVWSTLAFTTTRSWIATGNSSYWVRNRPWPSVIKNSSAQPWVWRLEFHSSEYWVFEM